MPTFIKCHYCNKEKSIRNVEVRGKNFCNTHCKGEFQKISLTGDANPNFKHKYDRSFFRKIDTNDKAYILGFIAADGSIGTSSWTLKISQHERDIDILERINKKICSENLIKKEKENLYCILLNSKEMCCDVARHLNIGRGDKGSIVDFPNLESDELKWAFIRGLFDGDGHVINRDVAIQNHPTAAIASISEKMKTKIGLFLKGKDMFCYINSTALALTNKNCMAFLANLYSSLEESDLFLKRKKVLFEKWTSWSPKFSHSRKTIRYTKI